jgi:uncharacterized membrane protein YphA (DoxX/SURF4 family)
MGKKDIQISLVSSNAALIIFGIAILVTGLDYFYFAKQISLLLPGFLPHKNFLVHLTATALVLAGIAIIVNKQITTPASFLLAILFCGIAVAIDLRGFLNKDDEIKYLFAEALLKDIAIIAGALIIANFERGNLRVHKHRRNNSDKEKQNEAAAASA